MEVSFTIGKYEQSRYATQSCATSMVAPMGRHQMKESVSVTMECDAGDIQMVAGAIQAFIDQKIEIH